MAISNGTTNETTNGHTTATNGSSSAPPLPIVIAGGGCVGLFLALLLTTSSPPIPNPIIILEPSPPDPTSTRAMAHQPPTYPILSRVPGLLDEIVQAGSLSSGLCFRTSVANGSKVIASKTFDNSGEGMKGKGQLLLPQGKFQEILMNRLKSAGNVDICIGTSLSSFTPSPTTSSVSITTTTSTPYTPSTQHITASYLIGADGSHSPTRKSLLPANNSSSFAGTTLPAHLVATDLHFDFSSHNFMDANFVIDPENYGLIGRISESLWRVSYGVSLSLSPSEINDTVDEKLKHMLPDEGRGKDGKKAYEVVRVAPYKAHQRLASTLYQTRTCLIGDAAHLTNPYAGLGLASGIADASSLADVLVRILTGQASDAETLLNAWSAARREMFTSVVDRPSRMAYERVRSDVSSEEKVGELVGRDGLVGALKRGMPVVPASLETRGEELEGW